MRLRVLFCVVIVGMGGALVAVAAAPPKQVVIKDCQKTKPPVAFPHQQHVKKLGPNCKTCHHQGPAGKSCASANCHAGKAEGKRPGCTEMAASKNAFHGMCIGCHKKEDKGPKTCVQCHKK
jgi:hypothetical protein